jgi:hypothetical protein
MDEGKAKEIKDALAEDLGFKGIFSFNLMAKRAGIDNVRYTEDRRIVNGVGAVRSEGGYKLKVLLEKAGEFQIGVLSGHFGVDSEDIFVELAGPIVFSRTALRQRVRPAHPGLSIGHPQFGTGTLGCLVTDEEHEFILSNNHVLAGSNKGQSGDPILQPGPHDGGNRANDVIGLLDKFIPLDYVSPNKADAALVKVVNPGSATNALPFNVGAVSGVGPARPGDDVLKVGRTTGLTYGIITSTDMDIKVNFDGSYILFENQIEVSRKNGPFSQPGDSGSIILKQNAGDKEIVGLLFAGNATGYTYANHILEVLYPLNVNLV